MKIWHFEDLSNGFTPRLHLSKVYYPMYFNKQISDNTMQKAMICIVLLKNLLTQATWKAKHVVEADYFGVVSGKTEKDKFAKSGMTYTKSELVDAPIINEFPIALECEFIEYQSDETGLGVIGKVLHTSVEEANMKDTFYLPRHSTNRLMKSPNYHT